MTYDILKVCLVENVANDVVVVVCWFTVKKKIIWMGRICRSSLRTSAGHVMHEIIRIQ